MLSYERVYSVDGILTKWQKLHWKATGAKDAVMSGPDVVRKTQRFVLSAKVLTGTLQDERNEFTLR
ncbi:MAG: hypothetical protein M0Z77_03470 [Thermoplasmatales archaeon]|nr:hypothetical protein [Thermoplasmatales archaeon]